MALPPLLIVAVYGLWLRRVLPGPSALPALFNLRAQVLEGRLGSDAAAEVLGVSERTVMREWAYAKARLTEL